MERSECKPDLELPVKMNQVLEREMLHPQRESTPTREQQHGAENATCKVIYQHTHFNARKTEALQKIQVTSEIPV